MGGAPPTILGGAEFMQEVFTAIEQVVRNAVQTMQVPVRTAESRATTAMKAFLQLRPPTFKGEPDPLVAEDWLEQVTRALDTILVTEEDLRVLFESYQLQGDALQWWKTMEEVVAKKFAKAFVSTEEEKAKQFMRGLRPSIRNKIAGNLIKVYSTMVSAAAAIEESLNETRKIQNPKSSPNMSVVSSGQTSQGGPILFWLSPTGSSYYGLPTEGSAAAVAAEGTISHSGTGTINSQGATYLLSVWPGWSINRQCMQRENNQGATGSQQPTRSVGSEDAGTGLRYSISSGTVEDNWTA
ncbi:hypothetical protein Acr_06g0007760 [Actinidia rufa]|uniref:Retrotransposon gag domain-containing protein n=1 Tax=Actinidia rufa TaxID=165716 RepID=A0A7J0ERK9_9ERIC|nr:hypothetical protein Acr_06g0007760 [Actinidia rufa]